MKLQIKGNRMNISDVSSKRGNSVLGVVGKGVLVGLVASAATLVQAGMLPNQPAYVDDSCASAASGARHAGSRSGCTVVLNEEITEGASSSGYLAAGFSQPAASAPASVAPTISSAPLAGVASAKAALAAPVVASAGPISPVVSAPVAVVPAAVVPQQIIAAAPAPVVPAAQPVATPTTGNNLPAPTVAVFAVPEPGTVALLMGGFIALIGIRHKRSAAAAK